MDIKKIFIESDKGDVDVRIFIKENGEYVMCPYGRSPNRKWIGMAKLNYFITGNYLNETKEKLVENICDCINVGANFDKLNIEKCTNEKDLVSTILAEAKKNKYNNFHVISIDLSDMNDFVEVVEWERVGKNSNEWRGNPQTVKSINYDDFEKNVIDNIDSFIVPPIKRF